MLFEIDLPTTVENKFKEVFGGEVDHREELRFTGKELMRRCPPVAHWLISGGYTDCDLIMTVGTKEENAQVDQSVA